MADVYQFSQSSIELLDQCIAAASQPDLKWKRLFPPRPNTPENAPSEDTEEPADEDNNSVPPIESLAAEEQNIEPVEENENLEVIKNIAAVLESMPSDADKVGYITAQTNYEQLLPKLAGNLTSQCLEIIFKEMLESYAIRNETILLHFLPVYITRESCSSTLNLFIRCNKLYPKTILAITQSLFMNIAIPSKQLEELFKAADDKTRDQFLRSISMNEIPSDVFVHHLNTVSFLYKNCKTTFEIQNFILNGLQQSSECCKDDKNWGQCLLVFFEGLKEVNHTKISRQTLEQLLDVHNTPFKKRCQVILKRLFKTE